MMLTDSNTLTVEYGKGPSICRVGKNCHGIIYSIKLRNSTVHSTAGFSKVKLISGARQFSPFFRIAAKKIKREFLNVASKKQNSICQWNLTVMHIRGTDRGCMLEKLTEKQLTDKIASFGVPRKNEVVYLMTNMPEKSTHFNAIRKYFTNNTFFEARDIAMFKRKEFSEMGTFLVYIVEKQLQRIAEGAILTYKGHISPWVEKKVVGILAPSECGRKGKQNLTVTTHQTGT